MASFGHSGSQAPQLMQSAVMWVAISASLGGEALDVKLQSGLNTRPLCLPARSAVSSMHLRRPLPRRRPLVIARGGAAPRDRRGVHACDRRQVPGLDGLLASSGDRLCDTPSPDGYCTQLNCSGRIAAPTTPSCVLFGSAIPGCGYDDRVRAARIARRALVLHGQVRVEQRLPRGLRLRRPANVSVERGHPRQQSDQARLLADPGSGRGRGRRVGRRARVRALHASDDAHRRRARGRPRLRRDPPLFSVPSGALSGDASQARD